MSETQWSRPPAIDVQDLEISFLSDGSTVRAVRGVSLKCVPGEFVVIIGRSGCGKTTLLNALAGLSQPTSGTVSVLGVSPRDARGHVGYMFARDALVPWRNAVENVAFGLEIQGKPKRDRLSAAQRMLEKLGLGAASSRYPWQLSQGMRQRVALARTFVLDPEVLFMDEPFAALDAQTKISVRAEFMALWEARPRSVVFVTHDLTEALLLADRVLVMADGVIQEEVEVPFPHPRDLLQLMKQADFRELEANLWKLLI